MRSLTYVEVGASADDHLPAGYHHLRIRRRVGSGREVFERVGDAIWGFELQSGAGVRLVDGHRPARVGDDVHFSYLGLAVPCRIVDVEDSAERRGFAYGTLAGHPASGEERFVAVLHPDGAVDVEIVAFSRPSRWFTRLGVPVSRWAQRRIAARYLAAAAAVASGR